MKLRLRGNSVRLRLSRSDVEELDRTGRVEESVEFGPGQSEFVYALEAAPDAGEITATYKEGRISVRVPAEQARQWIGSEAVGIESGGEGLRVLIERDYSCLTERPGEDDGDAFPNPAGRNC